MFNLPNPGSNPANPFYYRSIEEQRRALQEAVTVELQFKKDADGKKVGGKKVRDKVYKMTFKNDAEMNKFMDANAKILDEGTEELEEGTWAIPDTPKKKMELKKLLQRPIKLGKEGGDASDKLYGLIGDDSLFDDLYEAGKENPNGDARLIIRQHMKRLGIKEEVEDKLNEGTPEYRAMMKKYKGSDMEKVFKILDKEGFRMGEQSDTLVRNMLKKHRGNVKKAAEQIMKDNPGMFDVNRMMMDHVELDEDVQLDEKVLTFTFRKTEDAREFETKAFGFAISTDIMMMPGGKTGVEVSTMDPKDDKRLITLAKKMGGRVHKIVEDVQLDEMSAKAHYNKMKAQGKLGGMVVTPIDRDRFPNREKEGLEGPYRSKKSGQVYYYDKKAGKYYDPLSDMYLEVKDVMESIEEGFASDAQRRAAFASGYKAKGKKKGVEEEYAMMTNIDWLLNDLTWSTIIIPNTFDGVQSGEYNSAFDWNGDGVLDMADVQLAIDLWQQGLGVMYADDYQRMLADMEAGRRSNVNKGGAQMQIGTRFGSKTSRPPAAPPDMSTGAGGR